MTLPRRKAARKAREWWLCMEKNRFLKGAFVTHPSGANSCGKAIRVREVLPKRSARRGKRS